MKKIIFLLSVCMFLSCCGNRNAAKDTAFADNANVVVSPAANVEFDADSAYSYVAAQTAFGPRVPNTAAHKSCADYLASELERHGAKLYVQEALLTAYNGDKLQSKNIIGSYNPDAKQRIMLCAHWDSRPYSDHDANEANWRKPLDGADDGASGVGILLEVARQLNKKNPTKGIDIIFFDSEDYGTPDFVKEYKPDTWCLGSQYWAENPHTPAYKAEFGILLDMVGAKGAVFYKEYTSVQYASRYVEKIWTAARSLGFGRYFINAKGGAVVDDHSYINEKRRIPCIDIINYDPDSDSGFAAYWHTQNDTMDNIDKHTLEAVGKTVLAVIYE